MRSRVDMKYLLLRSYFSFTREESALLRWKPISSPYDNFLNGLYFFLNTFIYLIYILETLLSFKL
jgi:hypothetical protein